MQTISINTLKQVVLLLLIAFLGIVLIMELKYFIPGLLGAITLYVLVRSFFFKLTERYRWKKWLAAILLILATAIVIALPIYLIGLLVTPKIEGLIQHRNEYIQQGKDMVEMVQKRFPQLNLSPDKAGEYIGKASALGTAFLGGIMSVVVNLLVAFFVLYFMLISGRSMEKRLIRILPLKEENKDSLWQETKNMVVSNAIGIPLLIICQCMVAALGYWIFDVPQFVFWGILTGVASLIPVIGTMIIWIPICIVMIAGDNTAMGLGLFVYCGAVVANIDNVIRFTLLKKIGDVHPLVTVFGVIVGLQLFGIMGLIFGPLLMTYFILLLKIYRLEFSTQNPPAAIEGDPHAVSVRP